MAHDVLWLSIRSDHSDEIAVHMEDGINPGASDADNTCCRTWPCSCLVALWPQASARALAHRCRRECWPSFRWGVRRALLALLVLTALPAEGSEPIRLQVIPYQVRNQEIPVLPFLLPPPPLLLEPAKPKKRRRNSGRHQVWEDDFDWLMD